MRGIFLLRELVISRYDSHMKMMNKKNVKGSLDQLIDRNYQKEKNQAVLITTLFLGALILYLYYLYLENGLAWQMINFRF